MFSNLNGSVINCTFINNTATLSGGLISDFKNVIDSIFINNSVKGYSGGALYGQSILNGLMVNSIFMANIGNFDGSAIAIGIGSQIIVNNSIFVNNSATRGGAILFIMGIAK